MTAQWVKKLPAVGDTQEMWFLSLGREDPLEEEWQSTPGFLPGEAHGQSSPVGYSPKGHKESDKTERLSIQTQACRWLLSKAGAQRPSESTAEESGGNQREKFALRHGYLEEWWLSLS